MKRQAGALMEGHEAAKEAAARLAAKQSFGLGSKLIGAGTMAGTGGNVPAAVGAAVAARAAGQRGPATYGSIADALARVFSKAPAGSPRAAAATVSPEVRALMEILGRPGARLVPAGAEESK